MRPVTAFLQRPFVRQVATVATGAAAAQGVTMAFAPVLTRLYGPEAFGLNGIFVSVAGVLGVAAALGYPAAVVLPAADGDAAGLVRLSLWVGLGTALAAGALLAAWGPELLALLRAESVAGFMWLLPLAMFAAAAQQVLSQWLVRRRAYGFSARAGVMASLGLNAAKAGLGAWQPSAGMLIGSHVAAGALGTLATWLAWRGREPAAAPGAPLAELARRHHDFALYRTPQNLINALSQSLPLLVLAAAFGSAAAGQYAIAIAVLGVPAVLVGNSVMAVFYPRISEAVARGEDARALVVQATRAMAFAGAWPFLLLVAAGPWLFEFAFGEGWRTAGVYAQWLAPWMFLQYLNIPAVSAVPALGLQRGLLVYELFSTGAKVAALWIGARWLGSDVGAVALFCAAGVVAYVLLIGWIVRAAGQGRRRG